MTGRLYLVELSRAQVYLLQFPVAHLLLPSLASRLVITSGGRIPSGDTLLEGTPWKALRVGAHVASWPLRGTYFAVGADGRAQELPGAAPAVHPEHAQDLQEAQAPQRRGQDIALVAHGDHGHRGNQHEDVWERAQTKGP